MFSLASMPSGPPDDQSQQEGCVMFHVGQEVACIKGIPPFSFPTPQVGNIYIVSAVDPYVDKHGNTGLQFSNLPNPPGFLCTGYWASSMFRPVAKTDISIFTAMLAPLRENEAA